jgi:hypothetical protein
LGLEGLVYVFIERTSAKVLYARLAQARRLSYVHLRSGITSSTEKQLNRQKNLLLLPPIIRSYLRDRDNAITDKAGAMLAAWDGLRCTL